MDALLVLNESHPGLAQDLNDAITRQKLSSRTVHLYGQWIARYLAFHDLTSPSILSERNVRDFLRYVVKSLSPSRAKLNQAREAILFLYEQVLHKPLKQQELDVTPF